MYCQSYGWISKHTWSYMTAHFSRANSSQKMTQVNSTINNLFIIIMMEIESPMPVGHCWANGP